MDSRKTADRLTEKAYHWLGPSELPPGKRTLRWLKHFPADIVLERSEPGSIARDLILAPIVPIITGPSVGSLLLGKWIASRIPAMINIGRSIAHRNPKAKPGQWWRRDWTYFTRPRMRQPAHIAQRTEEPMETRDDAHIPKWMKWLADKAKRDGRVSVAGFLDDWLFARSRVVGFVFDNVLVTTGLIFHLLPLSQLMIVQTIIFLIPGAIGVYVGFRNHDVRRALRGGIFQRAEDFHVDLAEPEVEVPGVPKPQHETRTVGVESKQPGVSGPSRDVTKETPHTERQQPQTPEQGPKPPARRPDRGLE
jgi:hypothetical protein